MRLLILIIAATTAIYSCRMCKKAHYYRQQGATKKYLPRLTDKSYFVYCNITDTTDVDTLYVVNVSDTMRFQFAEVQCDGDYFEEQSYSLFSGKHHDSLNAIIHSGTTMDDYSLWGNYNGFRVVSNFDVEKSGTVSVSNVQGDTLVNLPSYTIGGKTYKDVIYISTSYLFTNDHRPLKYYYAPDIGIIQFDVYDKKNYAIGATYQLVSYQIK